MKKRWEVTFQPDVAAEEKLELVELAESGITEWGDLLNWNHPVDAVKRGYKIELSGTFLFNLAGFLDLILGLINRWVYKI